MNTTSAKSHVTQSDIHRGLQQLGLRVGDLVVTHSSLSLFGQVDGGADAVIDALLEAVGDPGTLIMPSHTGVKKFDAASYDPDTTPVRKNIGVIPDTFWRRPDVLRSNHPPRHAWAAKGPLASGLIGYCEGHPIEAGHYFDILTAVADLDGYVLLLGCSNSSNTSIHSAQVAAFNTLESEHKPKREFLRSIPKRPEDFEAVDAPLREAGVMRMEQIGDAKIRLMRSRGLFAVVKQMYVTKYRDATRARALLDDVPDPASIDARYNRLIEQLKSA